MQKSATLQITAEEAVPPPTWEKIVEWWNSLLWWQKTVVIASIGVSSGAAAGYALKKPKT